MDPRLPMHDFPQTHKETWLRKVVRGFRATVGVLAVIAFAVLMLLYILALGLFDVLHAMFTTNPEGD